MPLCEKCQNETWIETDGNLQDIVCIGGHRVPIIPERMARDVAAELSMYGGPKYLRDEGLKTHQMRKFRVKPLEHGKAHTYYTYGCRCDLCQQARRRYNEGRAAQRLELDEIEHRD